MDSVVLACITNTDDLVLKSAQRFQVVAQASQYSSRPDMLLCRDWHPVLATHCRRLVLRCGGMRAYKGVWIIIKLRHEAERSSVGPASSSWTLALSSGITANPLNRAWCSLPRHKYFMQPTTNCQLRYWSAKRASTTASRSR